jgi:maltose O-acetyltransferase
MMRSEKEKMLAGELYHAGAPELQADAAKARAWMSRYNVAWLRRRTTGARSFVNC